MTIIIFIYVILDSFSIIDKSFINKFLELLNQTTAKWLKPTLRQGKPECPDFGGPDWLNQVLREAEYKYGALSHEHRKW